MKKSATLYCLPALSMLIQLPAYWLLTGLTLVITGFVLWRLKKSKKISILVLLVVFVALIIPGILIKGRFTPTNSNKYGDIELMDSSNSASGGNFLFNPMYYRGCGQ